jgi:cytochrome c-type biogenesis protein CcmF
LKASIVLVTATFILILYSTFLTRSGVLGDASVHSFTDLGLSGQLLIYLFFFLLGAVILSVARWKHLPSSTEEPSVYSREFWIFIGATTLCLMGFQVIAGTSIPVINKIFALVGIRSTIAPAADAVAFYSKFQLWFAVAIGLLSGVGQFFWWKKIDKEKLANELKLPTLTALLLFAIVITLGRVYTPSYIILMLAGIFTIVANGKILASLLKTSAGLSGGAVAHIGVGMMLIGILFSAGYSKVVSLNNTGMLISKEFSTEFNRDNLLLFVNEPRTMWGYDIEYLGERLEPRNHGGFLRRNDVVETFDPDKVVARKELTFGNVQYKPNDTIPIKSENTFFEIELRRGDNRYSLFPRAQVNEQMGGPVYSPDILRTARADLYAHVSTMPVPDQEVDWSKEEESRVKIGQEFFANDYVTVLESVERIFSIAGVSLSNDDVAVKATIRVKGEHDDYLAEPIFLIKDKMPAVIRDEVKDLGLRFTLLNIHPAANEFSIGVMSRQKDWVVIKALEKPYINVLWIGTLVLMVGFGMAMVRRFREFRKMKEKGLE